MSSLDLAMLTSPRSVTPRDLPRDLGGAKNALTTFFTRNRQSTRAARHWIQAMGPPIVNNCGEYIVKRWSMRAFYRFLVDFPHPMAWLLIRLTSDFAGEKSSRYYQRVYLYTLMERVPLNDLVILALEEFFSAPDVRRTHRQLYDLFSDLSPFLIASDSGDTICSQYNERQATFDIDTADDDMVLTPVTPAASVLN